MRCIKVKQFVALAVAGILLGSQAVAQPYKWDNVAMGGGGFISAIITCPAEKNLIYARTDVGGAYRWNEPTKGWIPITDFGGEDNAGYLGTESLAIDPSAPQNVYILAGISYFNKGKTVVMRSSNHGKTFSTTDVTDMFKAHGNGMGRQTGERLAVDPNSGNIIFCGTRRDGLFKSTDSAKTWTRVNSFPDATTANDNGICFVYFDKSSGTRGNATRTIYVALSKVGSDNLFMTRDGGETWAPVPGARHIYMPQRCEMDPSGILYITYANGAGPHAHWQVPEPMDAGAIQKYNTRTGTWTNIRPKGYLCAYSGISIDPQNPNKIVATTINKYLPQPWGFGDRIFVSTDAGTSWTEMFSSNKISYANGGFKWIEGCALHWAGTICIDPFNSNRVFVSSGNGVFMTENFNAPVSTWSFTVKGLEETVPIDMVSIPGGPIISVIGDYDGFVNYDITSPGQRHTPNIGSSTGVAFAALKPSFVVRLGGDGKTFPLFFSGDTGRTWKQFDTIPSKGQPFKGRVAVSADGSVVLWSPEKSPKTYRTADRGKTWSEVSGVSVTDAVPVADQVNPSKFYFYDNYTGKLLVSNDAGVTFSPASALPTYGSKILRTCPGIEGDIWAAMQGGGLYRSSNAGSSFTRVESVTYCSAVGLGKAAEGHTYPTIFIWGRVMSESGNGVFRSTDAGQTWVRVNDDAHSYGGLANGQFVVGDMNVFGRVYISTAGRGIAYGEPAR